MGMSVLTSFSSCKVTALHQNTVQYGLIVNKALLSPHRVVLTEAV